MTINLPKNNDVLPNVEKNEELKKFLSLRRSTKIALLDANKGPSLDELKDIIALAARVPDHGKIAPWRFILVDGDKRLELGEKMADILKAKTPKMDDNHYKMEKERFLRGKNVAILISSPNIHHPKVPVWEQELSAGAIGYNLILSAWSFGYAATWLSEWPMFDDDVKALLELKEDERIAGFFYFGYPLESPIERERPQIESIVKVL